MTDKDAIQLAANALDIIRDLGAHYGCRIEIDSSLDGSLGAFCCTASDVDRHHQGFGGTVSEAVERMRKQPARGSSNQTRTHA